MSRLAARLPAQLVARRPAQPWARRPARCPSLLPAAVLPAAVFPAALLAATLLAPSAAVLAAPAAAQQDDAARTAFLAGRYDEAVAGFAARVEATPSHTGSWRGLVRALAEVGRLDEAESAARRAAAALPRGQASTMMGEVLVLRGRRAEAEAAFRDAVDAGADDRLTSELMLAVLRYERGERDAAMRAFDRFIDVYNRGPRLDARGLLAVGTAVRYLGHDEPQLLRDALRAYDEAAAADPADPEPHVLAGELFLERYNSGDARASFQEVLARNPSHPRALLGMARVLAFDNEPGAAELARRALEVNPNLTPARVFLARRALTAEDHATAVEAAERALTVDPTALDALAVLAAARLLAGDQAGFATYRDSALSLNPRYSALYVTAAELSAQRRLYAEAAELARRAVALEPRDWAARGELGQNLLRTGAMVEGRQALETAFAGDPFNVWFKNTLDLLDTFEEYRETRGPRFHMVIHGDEADLLEPLVAELAEEAYARLAERYGASPAHPIRIELFPRQADFSVRTVGLTGLGALGASFGPVIAMASPSAMPGRTNWGVTLWHEIAHSFHLALSDHHVPRWFTEGLAVVEQRLARPEWAASPSPQFLAAAAADLLPPVVELSASFVRATSGDQLAIAYDHAAALAALIERDHGLDAVRRMLEGYRQGLDTEAVLRDLLGMEPGDLDRRLRDYLHESHGAALAALAAGGGQGPAASLAELERRAALEPRDFRTALALGRVLYEDGRHDDALPHLERAASLYPEYGGRDSPYWFLARIHQARGETARAVDRLAALNRYDDSNLEANLLEAELRESLGDAAGATAALERTVYIQPQDAEIHRRLAELHASLDRPAEVVRARRAVVALRPVDMAGALYDLAVAHRDAGETDAAREAVLRALERAPQFPEAQELLLELYGRTAGGGS